MPVWRPLRETKKLPSDLVLQEAATLTNIFGCIIVVNSMPSNFFTQVSSETSLWKGRLLQEDAAAHPGQAQIALGQLSQESCRPAAVNSLYIDMPNEDRLITWFRLDCLC